MPEDTAQRPSESLAGVTRVHPDSGVLHGTSRMKPNRTTNSSRSNRAVVIKRPFFRMLFLTCVMRLASSCAFSQSPVTIVVNTQGRGTAIPDDYIGISFGMK